MDKILEKISGKIDKGEDLSPFLFVSKNLELTNQKVEDFALDLLKKYEIPKVYLFKLEDSGEKLKIKEVKEFAEKANSKASYKFQIFFIENISRLTISASNSLLKFFEEPGFGNIIFTTNIGENGVLDTILSRVQIVDLGGDKKIKKDPYYQNIINNYILNKDSEIISYFYKTKLEKQDYINFLENLIIYGKENFKLIEFLEEINDDIYLILNNNVNAKYIVDKWLLKI